MQTCPYATTTQSRSGLASIILYIGVNVDQSFETASAIKSVIGSLAILKADTLGHEARNYTLTVGQQHWSNGSGLLREKSIDLPDYILTDNRLTDGSFVASLRSLLALNITASDCIATNALIDYIGGQDAVNQAIEREFGLETMRLVTDRLHFPGVDHQEQPYQVGVSSMADFVRYYAQIWPRQTQGQAIGIEAQIQQAHHSEEQAVYLLDCQAADLPDDTEFLHKTGSIFDKKADVFYGTVVDAGMLQTGEQITYVAAAVTSHRQMKTEGEEQDVLRYFYACNNKRLLGAVGVIADTEVAA